MRRPQQRSGFTLIEIAIAVFILLMLLMLAVPSMSGVLADRRLRRSFDDFNKLVRQAQELSVSEDRGYFIVWERDYLALQPEAFGANEEEKPTAVFNLRRGDVFKVDFPAALTREPAAQWVFWPSGNCEPTIINYKGVDGSWSALYSPLTARPALLSYVVR